MHFINFFFNFSLFFSFLFLLFFVYLLFFSVFFLLISLNNLWANNLLIKIFISWVKSWAKYKRRKRWFRSQQRRKRRRWAEKQELVRKKNNCHQICNRKRKLAGWKTSFNGQLPPLQSDNSREMHSIRIQLKDC